MMTNLPKHDDFYVPTLRVLDGLGGSATIEEIEQALNEKFGFDEDELSQRYPKSGALILPDRMSWARTYLKYADLISNPKRGVWVLTDEGRQALGWTDEQVRAAVAQGYQKAYQAYVESKATKQESEDLTSDIEPGEPGEGEGWSDKLLAKLQSIDPSAFERLSQRLLRESGFVKVQVTGKSGDGGIDGYGVLRVNLISFQVLFQCKRYKGSVAAGAVRDFRGAMQGRADKGLIITTGTFTPDARREATRDGAPAIDLIDGEAMAELLKSLRLGVRVQEVVTEQIIVDETFFDEI